MLIPIGGRVEHGEDAEGNYNPMWMDWRILVGIPHDYLVSGYQGSATNKLRLYSALASDSFNIHIFNRGDYIKAVSEKIASENISKILYPADEALTGKELRLTQEYFWSPVRCETCWPIMRRKKRRSRRCRNGWRSSSTTPIPLWRWQN